MMRKKNIAIFGGSFDPPHLGHLSIIDFVLEHFDIDMLIILVAYRNPFKSKVRLDANTRLRFMQILTEDYKNVVCSDYEISQDRAVESVDSILHFHKLYNPEKLYFIIGEDNLEKLPTWGGFEIFKKITDFIALARNLDSSFTMTENLDSMPHFDVYNQDSKNRDSSPLAQNDDINSSTNNINFSLQPQNDNLIQGQHSGLNHIETLDKTSHLNSLNVTSKTSLQNQDSLNSQNTKWYENFAKTHNIKLHYRDFSYNISSSDIMANLEMLKDFIPPQIREEALRILKKN